VTDHAGRRGYPTDLTDTQWALVASLLPPERGDLARLSRSGMPTSTAWVRYAFTTPTLTGLRPLRDPSASEDPDEDHL